jgi:hypothetical protein
MTEHVKDPPRRLQWRWLLFWPVVWLIDAATNPPMCLECLWRDAHADDDLGYDDLGDDDLGDD